jgi:hypothetical protein
VSLEGSGKGGEGGLTLCLDLVALVEVEVGGKEVVVVGVGHGVD